MFSPGDFQALVVLRTKEGEKRALDELGSPGQIQHIQPLLELDAQRTSPANQLRDADAMIRGLYRLGRYSLVDASAVAGRPGYGQGTAGPLGELADRLTGPADILDEDYPVPFVPVVSTTDSPRTVTTMARLSAELTLGAALRVAPVATEDDIERTLEQLRHNPGDLDIIVDLQHVDNISSYLTDQLLARLHAITQLGPFRSTSILSGSIPQALNRTASWHQPRHEETLWRTAVRNGAPDVRFADYGVVHPKQGRGHRSRHVNMKYTSHGHWLYLRQPIPNDTNITEQLDENPRAHTFRTVCRNLISHDDYSGPNFSWGDKRISAAAHGHDTSLGKTSHPVAVATSHHLAYLAVATPPT